MRDLNQRRIAAWPGLPAMLRASDGILDMLPVATDTTASVPTGSYVTVEQRGDGVSVLARVPADSLVE